MIRAYLQWLAKTVVRTVVKLIQQTSEKATTTTTTQSTPTASTGPQSPQQPASPGSFGTGLGSPSGAFGMLGTPTLGGGFGSFGMGTAAQQKQQQQQQQWLLQQQQQQVRSTVRVPGTRLCLS